MDNAPHQGQDDTLTRQTEAAPSIGETQELIEDPHTKSHPIIHHTPKQVGRYLIRGRLGEGGMGVVYEAFDPELERSVALKVLHPEVGSPSRARLMREAQAMAKLSHPNVVQIHDVGTSDNQVFIAMELVHGQTLRSWLKESERSWREILAMFIDAGRGLAAAHAAGLIHRDFKPENVLVGNDGRVRVADFGLAGLGEQTLSPNAPTNPQDQTGGNFLDAALTSPGAILGTPRYMSPEQHSGLEITPLADQFSFCVALHEGLFGSLPFAGSTHFVLTTNVLKGRYVRPDSFRRVPRWLFQAVKRGLSVEPAKRFPDIEALLVVLEQTPRQRRRAAAGGLAGATLFAGLLIPQFVIDEPCSSLETPIDLVWSPERRQTLDELSSDPTHSWQAARSFVDDYTTAWSKTYRSACLEHRSQALSDHLHAKAMNCLHRSRAALDTLLGVDQTGNGEDFAAAAARLPPLSRCLDQQWLGLDVLPVDQTTRSRSISQIREQLAQVEVLHNAGRVQAALAKLENLDLQAKDLSTPALSAELALVRGRLAIDRMDWFTAQTELDRAQHLAMASGSDAVGAEAGARLVFVSAMVQPQEDAVADADPYLASAWLERIDSPSALKALLINNRGVAHGMRGAEQLATTAFAEAVALAEATPDTNPVDHASYLQNLAIASNDQTKRTELLLAAQNLINNTLGPQHAKSLELSLLRARLEPSSNAAAELLESTCPRWLERLPEAMVACSSCYTELVAIDDQLGRHDAAIEALHDHRKCIDTGSAPEDHEADAFLNAKRSFIDGYEALLQQDHERAITLLRAAYQTFAEDRAKPWVARELANIDVLIARSQAELGELQSAETRLEAALQTYADHGHPRPSESLRRRHDAAAALRSRLALK